MTLTFDLTILKTFSAMLTRMKNICAKFQRNTRLIWVCISVNVTV